MIEAGRKKQPGFSKSTLGAIISLVIIEYITGIIGGDKNASAGVHIVGTAVTAPQPTTPVPLRLVSGRKVGKSAHFGCISEDALDEATTAVRYQDKGQFALLFSDRKCFSLTGREFSVVSTSWSKAQVRVYVGDGSVVLWTYIETTQN